MPLGLAFWIIMLVWLVFGFWRNWPATQGGNYGWIGGTLLEFILFVILGWHCFGPPIR